MPDTMQVRCYLTDPPEGYGTRGASYLYYPNVSARRAAQLAAQHMAATCTAVDYFEVIPDSYDYDSPGILIADWTGRPAVTINTVLEVA